MFLCSLFFCADKEDYVQYNAECGCDGGGQTDIGQACVRLDTHIVSKRQADQQRLEKPLQHNPEGLAVAVEITDHAEEHSG